MTIWNKLQTIVYWCIRTRTLLEMVHLAIGKCAFGASALDGDIIIMNGKWNGLRAGTRSRVFSFLPMIAFLFECGHWMGFFSATRSRTKHQFWVRNQSIQVMWEYFQFSPFHTFHTCAFCSLVACFRSVVILRGKKMKVGEVFFYPSVGSTNYPYWARWTYTTFRYQTTPLSNRILSSLYDRQANPKFPRLVPSILSAWICQSKNCWKPLNK